MKRRQVLCYATLPDGNSFAASIAAAAKAGFRELSLWLMTIDAARDELGSLQAVRDCLDEHGMRATSIELLHAWPRSSRADVQMEIEVMQTAIEVFEPELIMAGCMDEHMQDAQQSAQWLREECAALAPVKVALEFLPWSALPDPQTVRQFVEAVAADNIGYVIDSWHFARSGSDYDALSEIPGDKVYFLQLSDVAAVAQDDVFAETLGERLLPGEGVIDWPRLMQTFADMGVDCPVSTEQFSNAIKAMPLQQAATTLYRGLQYPFESAS